MNALVILTELTNLGVNLHQVGGTLKFTPASRVPDELLKRMKTHKSELIFELATTIRCPFCFCANLIDGKTGLWCNRCSRLAWAELPKGGLVKSGYTVTDFVPANARPKQLATKPARAEPAKQSSLAFTEGS